MSVSLSQVVTAVSQSFADAGLSSQQVNALVCQKGVRVICRLFLNPGFLPISSGSPVYQSPNHATDDGFPLLRE